MLTITKQSDYGILMLSYVYKKKSIVSLSELIDKTKLPQRFLARIASVLKKNQLLISKEGKTGGYLIGDKVNKFTLYQYLQIFEKNVCFCDCCDDNSSCQFENICHHKTILKNKLQKIIIDQLKTIKLIDLIK